MDKEKFTDEQICGAIEQWLEFGEDAFQKSHSGYFSGYGWAARVLKFHLEELRKNSEPENTV